MRNPEQLTEKIQELDTQLKEVSQRLNQQLSALQSVNSNLYAMEQLTEKIQELDTQLKEVSQRLNQQLCALRSVNINLYAMKEYFETRPVSVERKKKHHGREL